MNIKSIIEETITEFSAGNSVVDKLSKITQKFEKTNLLILLG